MLQQLLDILFALWLDNLQVYIRVSALIQASIDVASQSPPRRGYYSSLQRPVKVNPDSSISELRRRQRQRLLSKAVDTRRQAINYIDALPNEILLAIFEMTKTRDLLRCTVVCHRWHVLVTPILWRAPILTRPVCCLPPYKNVHSSQKGTNVLDGYQHAYSVISCSSSSSSWSSSSSSTVLSSTNNASCDSARIGCQQKYASDTFPIHLGKYGSAIRKLVLSPEYTTDCSVRQIVTHCPNITHLTLDGCKQITDISLLLLAKCHTIESLSIRYCEFVTDTGLVYLKSLPRLHSLYVAGLKRISCDGMTRLAPLRCLDVSECSGVTAVRELVRACGTALTHLSIARLNVPDLESIVKFCPNLVYLDARRSCNHRTWRADRHFEELIASVQRYNVVTDIALSRYYRRRLYAKQHAALLDQEVFNKLISGLPKLKYIYVTLWTGLTDHKVQQALAHHGQELAGIAVAGCRDLTCRAFGCKCRTMRHSNSVAFKISSNQTITVKGLNQSSCKH